MTPAYEDVAGCQEVVFEWAESFDTKDWERLSRAVAPTLFIDYRSVLGMKWDEMPAEQFVGMASNPHFLGNKRIRTQHFIGASRWAQSEDGSEMKGTHQMRVAHQKYKDDELSEVLYKGHAHGNATVHYRRVDGAWKFAGLEPGIRWVEHLAEYEKMFGDE
ncbi:hypothetical protein LTR22_021806 [Elasticomyces elasticus]|nr:hypothetical protein LTR22_021806 [Elasticomyces elasticus]